MAETPLPTPPDMGTGWRPASDPMDDTSRQLVLEISKTLLSNTVTSGRNLLQILEGLDGVFLASYVSILVGLGKQIGVDRINSFLVALPIIFYAFSLLTVSRKAHSTVANTLFSEIWRAQ
jgi:hypothetical protein